MCMDRSGLRRWIWGGASGAIEVICGTHCSVGVDVMVSLEDYILYISLGTPLIMPLIMIALVFTL